jgi:hypothetical protein
VAECSTSTSVDIGSDPAIGYLVIEKYNARFEPVATFCDVEHNYYTTPLLLVTYITIEVWLAQW